MLNLNVAPNLTHVRLFSDGDQFSRFNFHQVQYKTVAGSNVVDFLDKRSLKSATTVSNQ